MSKLDDDMVRQAKPREKQYKLADGNGFYLLVLPTGSRLWRMDYRHNGRRKTLAIGIYPKVKLADARKQAEDARQRLEQGVDPSAQRKADRQAEEAQRKTFGEIVDTYLERVAKEGGREGGPASERTMSKNTWLLKTLAKDLLPKAIRAITPADVLGVLQKVEASGRLESAVRLRAVISDVFELAGSLLLVDSDPTWALGKAISKPVATPRAAITDEKDFGALMSSIDVYDGWPTLRGALLFEALTVARPEALRLAEWAEIDEKHATWKIPARKLKMRRDHEVPLSRQALAVLAEMKPISGHTKLIFPSIRSDDRPLSENAMNSALRRMGYEQGEHCAHGFRSSFSTILNERRHDPELIEFSLAHYEAGGKVRSIYNRARYWPGRVKLMQDWADLIDSFKAKRKKKKPATVAADFDDLLG
ncbi:integrase arm-type DNA-binding domain-containing protein [Mesorhizobium sp.]|uniref:tyrosine-type recombinase/integrase n=1 Tax=Mesorhizobium sp. TaxID=1871066 RepID=UPI0025C56338|nr:integrase arm-type DNA-binding domain-containing protein [Mesorhizobium sp.]